MVWLNDVLYGYVRLEHDFNVFVNIRKIAREIWSRIMKSRIALSDQKESIRSKVSLKLASSSKV